MARTMAHRRSGYTLIELLVVMAVLAILASMAMPLAELNAQRDRERELKRALWEIRDGIDAYRRARESGAIAAPSGTSNFPPNLLALTTPVPDGRPDRRGEMLRFLRKVPRDPFGDPALPADQTWGLRSYLSDASNPQPGLDVYDVFTRSEAKALNGMPLREW